MFSLTIFPDIVHEDSSIKQEESCDKIESSKIQKYRNPVVVELDLEVGYFFSNIRSKVLIISTIVSKGANIMLEFLLIAKYR